MYTQNEPLLKKLKEKEILIASHRGACGGSVCQNNRLSYKTALLFGADMIEMDVIQSKDGAFYAFHNGTEAINFGFDKDIREMSSEEIDTLRYRNWLNLSTDVQVAKMEDILDEFEEQCLINIDRAWFYWADVIQVLSKRKNMQSILLKSAPEPEFLQTLEDSGSELMYMPIVKSVEDWERVKEYNINVAAVEVIFDSLEHPLVAPELFKEWEELGILPWVNVISLGDEPCFNLSSYLDDNHAIENGFDENWGRLMRMGFKILQTDWPGLVSMYLEERKNREENK